MKLGYLSKNSHILEKNRNKYILKKYQYKQVDEISFLKILSIRPTHFFLDDHLSFFELLKIIILFRLNFINKDVIRCSEMYTIDWNSYKTEIEKNLKLGLPKSSLKKIIYKIWHYRIYFKHILFDFILLKNRITIFLPSKLRKEYFINYNIFESIVVLRNLPMMQEMKLNEINWTNFFETEIIEVINSHNFYLLAGNINSINDLEVLLKSLINKKTKVLIATNNLSELQKIQNLYQNIIYEVGILPHNIILNLVHRCKAGIILYNNFTINQIYSASSKLFEFMYFNKKIIVSENTGVLSELLEEQYPYSLITSNSEIVDVYYHKENFEFDSYIFENAVEKMSNDLDI
jgi:hypothetical protein